jgi:hypothetical protein
MSSPIINIPQANTSLELVMNLVRSLVNDTQAGATNTPGEGQILTDNPLISPFTLPFLNSAIRELYRELRNVGDPVLIKDNVIITGLPIVNSPVNGVGGIDPAVQTILSPEGYFDGVMLWPNFLLPSDMIYPTFLWERSTGSNSVFQKMSAPSNGLNPAMQGPYLREWEWRNNQLNFRGATTNVDIRMRYYAQLPQFFSDTLDFKSTYIPVLDCADAVAYKVATMYASMLGSPGLAALEVKADKQMFQLKNANVRRMQHESIHRQPFGNSSGDINNEFSFLTW